MYQKYNIYINKYINIFIIWNSIKFGDTINKYNKNVIFKNNI